MSTREQKFREFLIKQLLSYAGSSDYLVFINGRPIKHNDSNVFVRVNRDLSSPDIVFFTRSIHEGKVVEYTSSEIENSIMQKLLSTSLHGFDFKSWVLQRERESGTFGVKVKANHALKFIYFESTMYAIVRDILASRSGMNFVFTPIAEHTGKSLTMDEFSFLISKFRVNGFNSLLDMHKLDLNSRIRYKVKIPKFYSPSGPFIMAMFREENLYNPFFHDQILYMQNNLADRQIIKLFQERAFYYQKCNISVTYLSYYQISKALGLSRLVPITFRILVQILAGFLLTPEELPDSYPHKNKIVYRLNEPSEFPYEITPEEYEAASDYQKSFYVQSTSYNTFLIKNFKEFSDHGFNDLDLLIMTMEDAILQ